MASALFSKQTGASLGKKTKPYSAEEDEFIRQNWRIVKVAEIARRLNRPRTSIYARARDIGLRDESRYAREDTFIFTRAWYLKNQRIFARAMSEALESGEF